MTSHIDSPLDGVLDRCGVPSGRPDALEFLNQHCLCVVVDAAIVRERLSRLMSDLGGEASLAEGHHNLFASVPLYLPTSLLGKMSAIVRALTAAAHTDAYRRAAFAHAPVTAQHDPGSPGGLLGFDFHLAERGPQLIEINTNPGGLLLNLLAAQAVESCAPELGLPFDAATAEAQAVEILLTEWRAQGNVDANSLVAIVDEAPAEQFLYAEFLLYKRLLQQRGFSAAICDPRDLDEASGELRLGAERVGLVYNRLTDFALTEAASGALRRAYLNRRVAVSPHPRAHALWADKRNLCWLSHRVSVEGSGLPKETVDLIVDAVPATVLVDAKNREELWCDRRRWFFKPVAGFGSRASYRGDKLTHKTWQQMAAQDYVAQALVPPSKRHALSGAGPLKVDVRCYAYRGEPLWFAARLYEGQTTNFRTPGGGFAPVLTLVDRASSPESVSSDTKPCCPAS